MKSRQRIIKNTSTLFAAAMILRLAAETQTDTQVSQANNLPSQGCGIKLEVPDYLCRNTDDDQPVSSEYYEKWDLDHIPSPGDDDLKAVTITGTAGPYGGEMTLEIPEGGGGEKINYTFWKDGEKEEEETQLTWSVPANSSRSETLYIEGYENSDTPKDVKFKATMFCYNQDGSPGSPKIAPGETTVYEADLDIDSNNNEGLTFTYGTKEEDEIEDSEKADGHWSKRPGKIIMVNDGFGDDIPDWADGFYSDPSNADTATCGPPIKFVPMLLERKKPFTDKCKVKFTYTSSDPIAVVANPGRGFPGYDKHFTKPAGFIRIWKKDNDGSTRNPAWVTLGGDYVLDATEIPWKDLADGEVAHLWVEAVDPSGDLGDITIKAEIIEDGATCSDEVKITAIKITCEPIDAEPRDGRLSPYNPAGVVSGEDAFFRISVLPVSFPNQEINWKTNLSAVTDPIDGDGEEHIVRFRHSLGIWGNGSIWAEVTGNYYSPPKFNLQVFPVYTLTTVNIYEVSDASTIHPLTLTDLHEIISNLNEIYEQAGMNFSLGESDLLSQYSPGGLYDYSEIDNHIEAINLCAHRQSGPGELEVYIVYAHTATGDNVVAPGGVDVGIICGKQPSNNLKLSKIIAHEIGHSCGFEDIYVDNVTEVDSGGLIFDPKNMAKSAWSLSDWPSSDATSTQPSYYSRLEPGYATAFKNVIDEDLDQYATRQRRLVHRLLMHGKGSVDNNTELDIPLGRVYGVKNNFTGQEFDHVKVGIMDMDRQPSHF